MVPTPGLTPSFITAIVTGVTASGKTAVALEYAREHGNLEIVNADSLLVYRGMDIGTAKPTKAELAEIPHHLIDLRNPDESFTAGDYVREVSRAIDEIHARGKRALIVGGTGFYLKALLYGLWEAPAADAEVRARLEKEENRTLYQRLFALDEEAALKIGGNDRYRLIRALETIELSGNLPSALEAKQKARPKDPRFVLLITDRENDELFTRISARTEEMLAQGLLEETKQLAHAYPGARPLASVGYAESIDYLEGRKPLGRQLKPGLPGLVDEINLSTRQLVKRQRTWFRGQFLERKDAELFTLDRERDLLLGRLRDLYR